MAQLPTVACKDCGYVNEGERVYCHNCGVKLDRQILIEQQQKQMVSPEQKQRRLKKLMSPRRGLFSRTGKGVFKAIFWGAIAAVVIEILRPPQGALDISKKGEIYDVPPIDTALETLVAAPAGQQKVFQEAEVNGYLKREKFKKLPSWLTDNVPLRGNVNFEEGVARVNIVAKVFGYPLYFGIATKFETSAQKGLIPVCTGGNIGRLQIPAAAAKFAEPAIPWLFASFQNEQKLMTQLGDIQFDKGRVIFSSRGGSSPGKNPPAPANPVIVRPASPR